MLRGQSGLGTHLIVESVFRGGDLAAAERLDGWREYLSRTHAPVDVQLTGGDFDVAQRIVRIGEVTMAITAHFPATVQRSRKLIRQSDPDAYYLGLPISGATRISQSEDRAEHHGRHFVFHDSSAEFTAETDYYESVSIGVPKAALAFPADISRTLATRPLTATEGVGALLAMTMTRVAQDITSFRPTDGARVGTVLIDLVNALFAHVLEVEGTAGPRPRVQIMRIRAFIEQHLADPGLTPQAIADAHHISLSYLHRLYQQQEVTVAAWIRRQRLDRARRDLADPALAGTPVHAIGNRWGFPRAADFTRAFRTAYGVPPSDYRNAQCTQC